MSVVVLSPSGLATGRKLAEGLQQELHARTAPADRIFDDTAAHLRELFAAGKPILFVGAAGALIRILAPVLSDKHSEPPVVSLSEDGRSVVPLLGGHHGANDLARRAAAILDGHAAVTTAGDLRFGVALDAPPEGYRRAPERVCRVKSDRLRVFVRFLAGLPCPDRWREPLLLCRRAKSGAAGPPSSRLACVLLA